MLRSWARRDYYRVSGENQINIQLGIQTCSDSKKQLCYIEHRLNCRYPFKRRYIIKQTGAILEQG